MHLAASSLRSCYTELEAGLGFGADFLDALSLEAVAAAQIIERVPKRRAEPISSYIRWVYA
jgi:hypothetical protein